MIFNRYWYNQRHSYSLIERGSPYLAVFEGLFDALTWEQLGLKETDILILNSVSNLDRALEVFGNYEVLILGLDNDDSGNLARRKIKSLYGEKVLNLRFLAKVYCSPKIKTKIPKNLLSLLRNSLVSFFLYPLPETEKRRFITYS